MAKIHPTAIIDASARIAKNVEIGPYCVVGANVVVGENSRLMSHVVVGDGTTIGKHNLIHPFSSIGGHPQTYDREISPKCRLEIGDHNTIYESVTLNRGTEDGGGITRIGHRNILMAYVHVAKNCQVHNDIVLINHATLGGHVVIHDHAVLSAFVAIRQCCVVGEHAFVTRASKVTKDVLAYTVVQGNPPKNVGINKAGLLRRGFEKTTIDLLESHYRTIFSKGLTVDESVLSLTEASDARETNVLVEQLRKSERGIVR